MSLKSVAKHHKNHSKVTKVNENRIINLVHIPKSDTEDGNHSVNHPYRIQNIGKELVNQTYVVH